MFGAESCKVTNFPARLELWKVMKKILSDVVVSSQPSMFDCGTVILL